MPESVLTRTIEVNCPPLLCQQAATTEFDATLGDDMVRLVSVNAKVFVMLDKQHLGGDALRPSRGGKLGGRTHGKGMTTTGDAPNRHNGVSTARCHPSQG